MGPSGYMSLIRDCYSDGTDIPTRALDTLELFTQKECISTYQTRSILQSIGLKISYKSVHKRIQKLLSLHLIKEKQVRKPKHGAIYYMLSEYGIYSLFLKRLDGILFDQLALKKNQKLAFNAVNFLKYYSINALFETFLYPYLDKETILSINDPNFIIEIFRYLHDCCKEVDSILSLLDNKILQIPILIELFSWNKIHEGGEDNAKLIASLKQIFNLKEKDIAESDIKKIDKDTVIQVTGHDSHIFVKLDMQKQKAIAIATSHRSSNRQYEYDYLRLNNDFKIGITKNAEESLADGLSTGGLAEILLIRLVLKLAASYKQENRQSLKILSQDTQFMQLIENTYKGFEEGYQKLMNMRINS